MNFREDVTFGVRLPKEASETIVGKDRAYMATPDDSIKNLIVTVVASDIPGVMARICPIWGSLERHDLRQCQIPHNAGDFGSFLVGAPHDYTFTQEELDVHRMEGHLDIRRVSGGGGPSLSS